jgi:DNA-binding NarL/FixJ family response regulator
MPPMKMIIVDNSPETRNRLLGLIAQVDGIDVVGMADDAKTGMLLAKAHRPDLAIVNLQLEEESGIGVIQGIKEADPESNVVALTSKSSLERRADALAAGTDYLFDKADDLDRLAGLLRLLKNIHAHSDVRH